MNNSSGTNTFIWAFAMTMGVSLIAAMISTTLFNWQKKMYPLKLPFEAQLNEIAQSYSESPSSMGVAAWIPYWDQDGLGSLQQNGGRINYAILFWYTLDSSGAVKEYSNASAIGDAINTAHEQGSKALISIANLSADNNGEWNGGLVGGVIDSSELRKKHIDAIISQVEETGADGAVIDYESLDPSQQQNFSEFIKELSGELHSRSKLLGVALAPKNADMNPAFSAGSEAQDWLALQEYADQLHLMTYDQHWQSSGPGAIASVSWLKEIVNYAKSRVPQDKLFVGLPLYGYDWKDGQSAEGLEYVQVDQLLKKTGAQPSWDSEAGSHHFAYQEESANREVWYEDADSLKAKLTVLKELQIKNIFLWRLGGEDKRIWDQL